MSYVYCYRLSLFRYFCSGCMYVFFCITPGHCTVSTQKDALPAVSRNYEHFILYAAIHKTETESGY